MPLTTSLPSLDLDATKSRAYVFTAPASGRKRSRSRFKSLLCHHNPTAQSGPVMKASKARGIQRQRDMLNKLKPSKRTRSKTMAGAMPPQSHRKQHKKRRNKKQKSILQLSGNTVSIAGKLNGSFTQRARMAEAPVFNVANNLVHKLVVAWTLPSVAAKEKVTLVDVLYNYSCAVVESVLCHKELSNHVLAMMTRHMDNSGNNVVHIAAFNREWKMMASTILPMLSCDPICLETVVNAQNDKQCTPLDLAVYDGNKLIVETLLKHGARLGPALYTSNQRYTEEKIGGDIRELLWQYQQLPFQNDQVDAEPDDTIVGTKDKKKKKRRRKKRRKRTLTSTFGVAGVQYTSSDRCVIPKLDLDCQLHKPDKQKQKKAAKAKTVLKSGWSAREIKSVNSARWSEVINVLPESSTSKSKAHEAPANSRHFSSSLTDSFFQSGSFHEFI